MSDEIPEDFHDVVKLMLKRMNSNPEEFAPQGFGMGPVNYRHYFESVQQFLTPAEKAALKAKHREVALGLIHKKFMASILEGPKRD